MCANKFLCFTLQIFLSNLTGYSFAQTIAFIVNFCSLSLKILQDKHIFLIIINSNLGNDKNEIINYVKYNKADILHMFLLTSRHI